MSNNKRDNASEKISRGLIKREKTKNKCDNEFVNKSERKRK